MDIIYFCLQGNIAQQGTSNDGSSERGAKMGGPSGSSAGASTSNPSGSLHKRSSQLKYLTDYFPDQTSERDFRLTRSRSRATAQLRQVSFSGESGVIFCLKVICFI